MTDDSLPSPPRWAERLLRTALKPTDRDAISGDLLEAYRDAIRPSRSRLAADLWYVRQVSGYIARTNVAYALLYAGMFVGRNLYDCFVPTTAFATRSLVTTFTLLAIWSFTGMAAAWRCRSVFAAVVASLACGLMAAVVSIAADAAFLTAFAGDVAIRRAIDGSGGIDEWFLLPIMWLVPVIVFGVAGGVLGRTAAAVYDAGRRYWRAA